MKVITKSKKLNFIERRKRKSLEIHIKTEELNLFFLQFEAYIQENKDFFKNGNFELIGMKKDENVVEKIDYLQNKYNVSLKITQNKKFDPTLLNSSNFTNYHLKTIRSGQSITFDGDVVIMGDVNSGGEIMASGNITISGTLRGKAHCGYPNNNHCFIIASKMANTQVRVGEHIGSVGNQSFFQREAKIAYLKENEIKITSISQWQRRGE